MNADDERRFREFVSARSPALMRVAFLLTGGDQHGAEDLVQSALSKALPRWGRIAAPEAYVRRTMYRQQISWWRLARNRRETVSATVPDEARDDLTAGVDLHLLLRAALETLTPRQRTVLVLRYFEDLPEREVAALLGISVGTVRSTTHRSLAKLRENSPGLADLSFEVITR